MDADHGVTVLGPYRDAADVERALREGLARLLGTGEAPAPSSAS